MGTSVGLKPAYVGTCMARARRSAPWHTGGRRRPARRAPRPARGGTGQEGGNRGPTATSRFKSRPVATPRRANIQARSSVATLPVAPGAKGAAAEPRHRGIEHSHAGLEGGMHVGGAQPVGVVGVERPGGPGEPGPGVVEQRSNMGRVGTPRRVAKGTPPPRAAPAPDDPAGPERRLARSAPRRGSRTRSRGSAGRPCRAEAWRRKRS